MYNIINNIHLYNINIHNIYIFSGRLFLQHTNFRSIQMGRENRDLRLEIYAVFIVYFTLLNIHVFYT